MQSTLRFHRQIASPPGCRAINDAITVATEMAGAIVTGITKGKEMRNWRAFPGGNTLEGAPVLEFHSGKRQWRRLITARIRIAQAPSCEHPHLPCRRAPDGPVLPCAMATSVHFADQMANGNGPRRPPLVSSPASYRIHHEKSGGRKKCPIRPRCISGLRQATPRQCARDHKDGVQRPDGSDR